VLLHMPHIDAGRERRYVDRVVSLMHAAYDSDAVNVRPSYFCMKGKARSSVQDVSVRQALCQAFTEVRRLGASSKASALTSAIAGPQFSSFLLHESQREYQPQLWRPLSGKAQATATFEP
jgi:hypothetical protein